MEPSTLQDRPSPADAAWRPGGRIAPVRSSLRWPAAAAALVAAAAHLPMIRQHLTEVPYVGWLFVGLSVALVLGAAALALRDAAILWTALASICLAAVACYAVSRGPGMPGMPDDVGDWTNPLGLISVGTETLVVMLAMLAVPSRRATRHRGRASGEVSPG
jgi:hypothetical protein